MKSGIVSIAAFALMFLTYSQAYAASADDTRVVASSGTITDATGARWTINNGYIYVNGVRDTHTANVICLAYEGGHIWQENTNHLWYEKTKPSDAWAPSGGRTRSPLPPITATVSNGYMSVRTDPQTVVGITAIGSNSVYQGSTSVTTDNYGNAKIPVSSPFGRYTYLVSKFRNPMMLSEKADIAMFSIEQYEGVWYYYLGGGGGGYYFTDLSASYGPKVGPLDWTTLVALNASNPTAFSTFAASLGSDQAYVFYNGSFSDANDNDYVVRTSVTANTITSIAGKLYLDLDKSGIGRVVYYNYGPNAYAFNTVASVSVVVP